MILCNDSHNIVMFYIDLLQQSMIICYITISSNICALWIVLLWRIGYDIFWFHEKTWWQLIASCLCRVCWRSHYWRSKVCQRFQLMWGRRISIASLKSAFWFIPTTRTHGNVWASALGSDCCHCCCLGFTFTWSIFWVTLVHWK